jgi:hypothetical protein
MESSLGNVARSQQQSFPYHTIDIIFSVRRASTPPVDPLRSFFNSLHVGAGGAAHQLPSSSMPILLNLPDLLLIQEP